MSNTSVNAIVCDECEKRRLITGGTKEGMPLATWLSKGWVEIKHRMPDDHVGIETTHYCDECASNHVRGERFEHE